jgi:hypothetical protein
MSPTQLSPQCGDNLFTVSRPLFLEHTFPNPLADMPVQANECRIDRAGGLLAGSFDQRANIAEQLVRGQRWRSRTSG